jgi:hypothetical protein
MTLTKQITLDDYLRELAKDVYSPASVKARKIAGVNRNTSHMRIINRCAEHLQVSTMEFIHARALLMRAGLVYSIQGTERGGNGKIMNHYRLTEKGKAEHAQIVAKLMPKVNQINQLIKEGQAV